MARSTKWHCGGRLSETPVLKRLSRYAAQSDGSLSLCNKPYTNSVHQRKQYSNVLCRRLSGAAQQSAGARPVSSTTYALCSPVVDFAVLTRYFALLLPLLFFLQEGSCLCKFSAEAQSVARLHSASRRTASACARPTLASSLSCCFCSSWSGCFSHLHFMDLS